MNIQLLTSPIPFSELPNNSIALDGAVRGCHLDLTNNRWSFDHHAWDQPSLSTRSSALQTLLALRAGLDVSLISNVFVSSIDADSVLSTGLVMRPALAKDQEVIEYVTFYLDPVDSLGPCGALSQKHLSIGRKLTPAYLKEERKLEDLTTELLLSRVKLFFTLYEEGKLFEEAGEMPNNPSSLLSFSNQGAFLGEKKGVFSFLDLYSSANIGALRTGDKVTIGAKSSFVTSRNFLNDGLWQRLNDAEKEHGAELNESGELTDKWGGKDLIGGSPFKNGTLLSNEALAREISSFLQS